MRMSEEEDVGDDEDDDDDDDNNEPGCARLIFVFVFFFVRLDTQPA